MLLSISIRTFTSIWNYYLTWKDIRKKWLYFPFKSDALKSILPLAVLIGGGAAAGAAEE